MGLAVRGSMVVATSVAALALAACGRLDFAPTVDDVPGDAGEGDGALAASDAAPACDPLAPFGAPQPIAELNVDGAYDSTFQLAPDELTGYFYSDRAGSNYDLYFAQRADLSTPWSVSRVASVDTASIEKEPAISPDRSVLVFSSDRAPSTACCNLYVAAAGSGGFGAASEATVLASSDVDYHPFFQLDSNIMWFASNRTGDFAMYTTTYAGTTFAAPVHVGDLDVAGYDTEVATVLSGGFVMYFRSNRPGGLGGLDIWRANRASTTEPWGNAVVETELDSTALDTPNWISRDGCRLYMSSSRTDASDIFLATRTPP